MSNDIAYKMVWTSTGMEQVLDKSQSGLQKLSTATANLISRLEKKAAVADMGADAFALAQAKAIGASAETQHYISGLQQVVQHISKVKAATAEAAAESTRLTGSRQQILQGIQNRITESHVDNPHDLEKLRVARQLKDSGASHDDIDGAMGRLDYLRDQRVAKQQAADEQGRRQAAIERHAAVPDNESLRQQSEYDRKQAAEKAERAQRDAERRSREEHIANRRDAVPDNESLRQATETKRFENGQRAASEVNEQLRKSTKALRDEEIAAIKTKLDLAGATDTQRAAAMRAVDAHQRAMNQPAAFDPQAEYERRFRQQAPSDQVTAHRGKRAQIGLEMSRAFEDAIAGGSYGGVKGAIMGASNNISQMGAIMGPTAAIVTSIGSMAAILGATLIPKIYEWATSIEAVKKKKLELAEASKKAFELESEQMIKRQNRDHDEAVQSNQFEKDKLKPRSVKEMTEEKERLQREKEKNERIRKEEEIRQHRLGQQKPKSEAQVKAEAKIGVSTLGWAVGYGSPDEALKERKKQEEKRQTELRESKERASDALRRNDVIRTQQGGLDTQIKDQKVVEDRGRQGQSWQAEQESNAKIEAAEKSRKQSRNQERLQIQNMNLSMLHGQDASGNTIDDDGRRQRAAKSELDRRERDKQITRWQKEELITAAQAEQIKTRSSDQRDREIRKGAETPHGQRAQALDIRSGEGMSQLLRALNSHKDDIARQHLDVSKQTLKAIEDANNVSEKLEVTEVHFS